MEKEYHIDNTTKWLLLVLAGIFDAVQLITPPSADFVIVLFATITFAMIFFEKGALTIKSSSALRFVRIFVIFLEIFISNVPAITIAVALQITISRITDKVIPEGIHSLIKKRNIRRIFLQNGQLNRLRKEVDATYGKGRRGRQILRKRAVRQQQSTQRMRRSMDAKISV